MSDYQIACPHCGVNLEFDAADANQTFECPACQGHIAAGIEDAPKPVAVPVPLPVPKPSVPASLQFCKECGGRIAPSALICPHCGNRLRRSAGESIRWGCGWFAALFVIYMIVSMFFHDW
jgi:uncharacterized paraquat-inducible protein A